MIRSYLICCILIISSCKSSKYIIESSLNKPIKLDKLAQEKYGNNYSIVDNPTSEFSLVRQKTKDFRQLGFDTNYFIYDHNTSQILIEDSLKKGHVEWINEYSIKAISRDRTSDKKVDKKTYLFHARNRKKDILDN